MSWIDKEVKKRERQVRKSQPPSRMDTASEAVKMAELWSIVQAANDALPPDLKLQGAFDPSLNALPGAPIFIAGLRAPNGAGLGFTGDAVRYTWPERSQRVSHNFWIRWKAGGGYTSTQRAKPSATAPKTSDRTFDPARVEYLIKCLVLGIRVTPRAIRKRRLWIF